MRREGTSPLPLQHTQFTLTCQYKGECLMMDTLNIVLDLVLVVLNLTVIVLLLKKKGE